MRSLASTSSGKVGFICVFVIAWTLGARAVGLGQGATGTQPTSTGSPSTSTTPAPTGTPSGAAATGSGASGLTLAPLALNFGDHDFWTTTYPETIRATNTSQGDITLTRIFLTGTRDFYFSAGNLGSLAPNKSIDVAVWFSPGSGPTKRDATLSFDYRDAAGRAGVLPVFLSGNGFPPGVMATPSSLDFGDQLISCHATRTVAVTAGPEGAGKFTFASTNADYSVSPQSCQLGSGETCAVTVTFTPSRLGQTETYITIVKDTKTSPGFVILTGTGVASYGSFGTRGWLLSSLTVLVIVLLYLGALILVRWQQVARPAGRQLIAQVQGVRRLLRSLDATPQQKEQIEALLDSATRQIPNQGKRVRLLDFLFWNRGQEMAGWSYVHEAQQQMSALLPDEVVEIKLLEGASDLSAIPAGVQTGADTTLASEIMKELAVTNPANQARRRALLSEALGRIYELRDDSYSSLMSWYNKTVWMICCGLLLVMVLAGILDHSVLFLMGALGGLLSRLARAFHAKDMPTDYGSSWTPLFLSPVAGALAGWSGILLIILGKELNIFGSTINVDWCNSYGPITLALAFVLGFSERAFDQILTGLEQKLTPTNTASASTTRVALTASGLTPSAGLRTGPAPVTITGTGFVTGAKVTFGILPSVNGVVSADGKTVTVTPPASTQPGTVKVTVQNPDGSTANVPGGFEYQ